MNSAGEFKAQYSFNNSEVTLKFTPSISTKLVLPIIAATNENVEHTTTKIVVEKPNANLIVSANMPIVKRQHLGERNFNHCGGFETYYAEIEIPENTSCEVLITLEDK